jgi:putative nucleotidyltransferase with HDIG domain
MENKQPIEKIILDTVDIPGPPVLASRILGLVEDDKASLVEMEKIISNDASFSTRLLRIANSPYYGMSKKINTVSEAVLHIGFNTMKSLVITASINDIHRSFGEFEQRLWEHSLGVSIAASILAAETEAVKQDEALISGLIHDMGKIILNNAMPDSYASMFKEIINEKGFSFLFAEAEMLGFNHCDVGGVVARKWNLPESLAVVIESHHPETLPTFSRPEHDTLCRIVHIADAMCLNAGIGFSRSVDIQPLYLRTLGLLEKDIKGFYKKLKKGFREQKKFLKIGE